MIYTLSLHDALPISPLVLLSRDAARRGAGVQGLRLGDRWTGALHAAHLVRRPGDAAGVRAAPEHRGAGDGLLLGPRRERRAELGALPARIGGADHAEIIRP